MDARQPWWQRALRRLRPTPRLEFAPGSLPWLDRAQADVAAYVRALPAAERSEQLEARLLHWRRFGYVQLPNVVPHALIDAFLADMDELMNTRARHRVEVMVEGLGTQPIHAFSDEALRHPHMRYIDFHCASIAAKKIMLQREIVSFVGHLLRDRVVALQSLTFMRGSEQWMHQDYAFVVTGIPSHLAAAWIALEDVHPDAGPLAYYPGSHVIPKFDWGNTSGLHYSKDAPRNEIDFRDHIEAECARAGLTREVVLPRKGDVFLWHGALAHSGSPVRNPTLTRRSFVVHYSSVTANPRAPRRPSDKPRWYEYNGARVYAHPDLTDEEDVFRHGADL